MNWQKPVLTPPDSWINRQLLGEDGASLALYTETSKGNPSLPPGKSELQKEQIVMDGGL